VPEQLQKLATTNYGVFIHLAACHQQLNSDPDLFAAEGLYTFYSHLYSVGKLVERFLKNVPRMIRTYNKNYLDHQLNLDRVPGLSSRFAEAFTTRTKDYRGKQVHDWGFPIIGQKIPRREHLSQWENKYLGQLDTFLKQSDAAARYANEFVDAIQQAKDDLAFVEDVMNEVWQVALQELDTLKDIKRYKTDQNAGINDVPPIRISTISSLSSSSAR
jgi:hypothetical protein